MVRFEFFGQPQSARNPLGGIGCLVVGILAVAGVYFVVQGLYRLLWWAAPALVVLALIINWKVVAGLATGYVQYLLRNPVGGILGGLLAVVLFPFLSVFILLAAMGGRRIDRVREQMNRSAEHPEFDNPFANPFARRPPDPAQLSDEFTDFEELESKKKMP
jgi:uncharacterized BrkB/YihY/UPF0761 family membrane protein